MTLLPDHLAPGAFVGRYRVEGTLGQGIMGTVYLAHDTHLDRTLALKILRHDRGTSAARRRMTEEARMMAKLHHPNIVTVFDAGEIDGRTYIAMERIVGETLAGWLAEKPRSVAEVLAVIVVAGRALGAAHAAGVVHRAFKPQNVLLDRAGRLAVTDFGMAADPVGDESSGGGGVALGAPGYLSPEHHAGEPVGPASDQFSLAAVLFEALFHRSPFAGGLPSLSTAERARVPEEIHRALLRALSRAPSARFVTMDAFVDELERQGADMRRLLARRRVALRAATVVVLASLVAGAAAWLHAARETRDLAPVGPPASVAEGIRPAPGAVLRPLILVAPFRNDTQDRRLDGVLEQALPVALSASRFLLATSQATFGSTARELGIDDDASEETVGRALLTVEHRPVVVVHGALAATGSGVVVSLSARDLASDREVATLSASVETASLARAIDGLAGGLRQALADPSFGSERDGGADDGPLLSSSLDALHEWASGLVLAHAGALSAARQHLRQAVALDPAFADAHGDLAAIDVQLGDAARARREDEIALRVGRLTDRSRLRVLGSSYDLEGRSNQAVAIYEQMLSIWPADLATQLRLDASATAAADFTVALEQTRRAVVDHPRAAELRTLLLRDLVATGQAKDAARLGDAALEDPRTEIAAFVVTALAHELADDREGALAVARLLAARDARRAGEVRADLALYEGRLDDATAALADADADDAETVTELRLRASTCSRRGASPCAIDAARRALALLRDVVVAPELLYALGCVLVDNGSDDEALALVRRWSSGAGAGERAYADLLLGNLALRRGTAKDLADAQASFAAAARLRDDWAVHERLGAGHLAAGEGAAALAELQICFERRGEEAVALLPSLDLLASAATERARALERTEKPAPHDF